MTKRQNIMMPKYPNLQYDTVVIKVRVNAESCFDFLIFEHHKYEIYTIICKIHEHRDLDTCGKRKIVCFNRNSRQLFPLSPNYISQNIRQFITWNKNCWKKCFVLSSITHAMQKINICSPLHDLYIYSQTCSCDHLY